MSKNRLAAGTVARRSLPWRAPLQSPRCSASAKPHAARAPVKLGFITKFPVDFYFTLVDGAKALAEDAPGVSVMYAPGQVGDRRRR